MKTCIRYAAAALIVLTGQTVRAQLTKTVPGETKTVTATVEAIERESRGVTVKKPDGGYEVFYVPMAVKRFDMLKVGDKITAKYYENMVLQLKAPGAKDLDKSASAVVPAVGTVAGTASHQRTITATITAIDPALPSITFTGPRNWTYTTRVKDKGALAKVKVGDKVDITWTEALVVSIDEPK